MPKTILTCPDFFSDRIGVRDWLIVGLANTLNHDNQINAGSGAAYPGWPGTECAKE
jgi:hypothetical protein